MNTNPIHKMFVFLTLITLVITACGGTPAPIEATATPAPPTMTVEPTVDPGECMLWYAFLLNDTIHTAGTISCDPQEEVFFEASVVGNKHSIRLYSYGDLTLVVNGGFVGYLNPDLPWQACPEWVRFAQIDRCLLLKKDQELVLDVAGVTNLRIFR